MTEFMDLVLPHVHRWRYLYLSQSRQAGGVLTRLSACYTPQLQQLCLFTHGFLAIEDLFRGKADRLRHVQLHATSLPWDSSIMCNLQTLELEDLQSGGPSAEQIVSILRASPGLVKLSLKSINSAAYLASNIHQVEPLELPSLNHLVISKLSVQATNHILSNLQFPSLHALVAESESATVFLGTQSMYLHCRKIHGTVLSITVDVEHWPMDFAERLLRHIHHANASLDLNVTIDPDLRGPHLTKVINLLPILCHTRTLLLQRRRRGGLNNSNAFIRQLATPQAFDGVLRWLLPQLEILTFNNVQITDEILDLVEQRYKLVGSDDLGTPEAPLSRLKSLKFAGGERALQRLTFVLGEGVVKPL
ncbi:hypothetical protein FRB98_008364 [Tulasnella sp. 332]|nr:hypothetical protein FRB98_008364 [Tulasnella sp. 332]